VKEPDENKINMDRPEIYVIRVRGRLPKRWQTWFEGMEIQADEIDHSQKITRISGPVKDQAALFGILERIRDLGIPLLEVRIDGEIKPEITLDPSPGRTIREE
jgi:hypothetical protein